MSLLLITYCASCKAQEYYLVKDYFNKLAIDSGIVANNEDVIEQLLNWKIIEYEDIEKINDYLDYHLLNKSISNLVDNKDFVNHIIANNKKDNSLVLKNDADIILDRAVKYINNKTFSLNYGYLYKSNVKKDEQDLKIGDIYYDENNEQYQKLVDIVGENYIYEDAQFEDVYDHFEIEDSFVINLQDSEIIPSGQDLKDSYYNTKFNLLASNTHSFSSDGFRVSYSVNASNISVHLSKNVNGLNFYGDLSLSNIKPTFKWVYDDDNVKHAYFRIDFNSTEKVGTSIGKYGNYYLNFKNLDSNNFLNKLKRSVNKQDDELEAIIPICTIKTPIPELPSVNLNLELLAKVYVSGKVELQLYNNHSLGFETKDGSFRIINDSKRDFDFIASGSSKAQLGINFSIEAINTRLADIEFDGGLKAELKPTIHLYDEQGNHTSVSSDLSYSTIEDISRDNSNVAVCADVSFNWIFDIVFNTYRSKLYKFGLTKTVSILDEDNQVFKNLHHIENGMFVKKCTRKNNKPVILSMNVTSNKITLSSYAEVLSINEIYKINVSGLPQGYSINDLKYTSEKTDIASVDSSGVIKAIKPGSAKIKVYTNDGKYDSYVNILVSSE